MNEPSDHELLARLREDPGSLAVFYRRHVAAVERYAVRRCGQPAEVADLVAATFLSVLERAPSYDERRGPAVPWLLGVAHNLLLGSFAEHQRQNAVAARLGGLRDLDREDFTRLEDAMDAARDVKAVEAAVSGLAFGDREVLWLIGHDSLSVEAAARVLGVSAATFRVRLHRARRSLRRGLKGTHLAPETVAPRSQEEPAI